VCEREWEELSLLAYLVVKIMYGGVYQSMLVTGREEKKCREKKLKEKADARSSRKSGWKTRRKKIARTT
jgi:hypothetical protein